MVEMNEHCQVPIKVTAFVDKGIAELVALLNDIPNVSTFSSCEGRDGKNGEDAHVYFFYGQPYRTNWLTTTLFANKLAEILSHNESYDTDIAVEWTGDKDSPYISIKMRPKQIQRVVRILCDHMSEFSYDTLYKELHSSIECLDHWS